jgi:Xaa-Pro aminopeptidase
VEIVTITNRILSQPKGAEPVGDLLDTFRVDALIISRIAHIRYLTGFTGSSALLLITPRSLHFLTDPRYATQAHAEVKEWKISIAHKGMMEEVKRRGFLRTIRRIGFESNYISHTQYVIYKKLIPDKKWVPLTETLEPYLAVKSGIEIEHIERAIAVAEKSYTEILSLIRPGMREREIAAELSYRMHRNGAEKNAFDIIVAGGARSALPHGVASDRRIKNNEVLLLDFGCVVNGYHSDITRTVFIGRAGSKEKKVYTIVREALDRATGAAADGRRCKEVDSAARSHIRDSGYGEYFGHSLGHGIGLDIHELPRLSPLSDGVLRAGNVVTMEPGIYIPGSFGIRIEDDVLITPDDIKILTRLPGELTVL